MQVKTDNLTPNQMKVVDHLDGPLLVLAGPGSGKTRVITHRIARMIERGVDPRQILAITFTNKAATEMASRVDALLPGCRVWVSTFHKFCARLLRQRAEVVGLKSNFTIYDTADQKQLIRQVLHELNIDSVHFPVPKIAARISRAKNAMLTAADVARSFEERVGDHMQAVVARVYPAYQKWLLKSNAVDFDDLLLHVVGLLTENPEIRRDLDARFRYILVDEYQDTNRAQYRIVASLSHDEKHLCATGDPDQSIYGWRGAQIDNILRFEADFPDATVVRLEQNFRSTKRILRSADSLIAHNVHRKAKSLRTDNPEGDPIELLNFYNGQHEAETIAREMRLRVEAGERKWSDFAIFYRVNALSREIEIALTRHNIPYQVAVGVAFYERAEIKDIMAYLRLIHNPDDQTAFRRIVNTPPRGIGKQTQSKLIDWAAEHDFGLLEAAGIADDHPELKQRASNALQTFAGLMQDFSLADAGSVEKLLQTVIERTNYTRDMSDGQSEQGQQRLANVLELLTAARQYDRAFADASTLEGFLEATSLASDADQFDEEAGQVTLMTLHAAKGLEFPVVYLIAVEQNLIPHERSLRTGDLRELEEERRLLFVGMTRAKEQLYLTQTHLRESRGRVLNSIRSDFLSEMELTLKDYTSELFDATSPIPDESAEPAASNPWFGEAANPSSQRPRLTTGADLLNGTANAADVRQGFAIGMTVRHPQYGLGTVTNVGGFGTRRTATVAFHDDEHTETFMQFQCPLQPVGIR
jgi:DNA helicase-2/ATP-dependent DNA helicase PcrA